MLKSYGCAMTVLYVFLILRLGFCYCILYCLLTDIRMICNVSFIFMILYMHWLPSTGSWHVLWTALVLLWTSSFCTSWQLLCFHSLVSVHTHSCMHSHGATFMCIDTPASYVHTKWMEFIHVIHFTGFYLYGAGNNIVSDHCKSFQFIRPLSPCTSFRLSASMYVCICI